MKTLTAGILAHVDAGKTTCIESMLYLSREIRKQGRVDHQDSFLDYDEQERKRGITIYSKQAVLHWKDTVIDLIDTPGHVDFSAEMERALSVLDLSVLLISASEGIQAHTRTIWKCLEHYSIPALIFVNKMDLAHVSKEELKKSLVSELSSDIVDLDEEDWMEQIAVTDEHLLEQFMENGTLSDEEIVEAFLARRFFPVAFGSALKNEGTEKLLDLLNRFALQRTWPEQFRARVYKISRDDRNQRLTHMKILGGSLKARQPLEPYGKADQIRIYSGTGYELVQEIEAGRCCAVKGLEETYSGQGLGDLEDLSSPMLEPSLSYELILPSGTDPNRLAGTLRIMEAEDPALQVQVDENSKAVQVRFMGAVQMEIFQKQLEERTGIVAGFGPGRILYRETITEPVMGYGHFEPLRHYGEIHLRLDPLPRNSGLQFSMNCPRDTFPLHWQRTTLNALQNRPLRGILTNSELTDMKITLTAGRAHPKHTSAPDFEQAARRAVRQGLKKTGLLLLEPFMRFRIETENQTLSRILFDLENRKCSTSVNSLENGRMEISGRGPLRTLLNMSQDLTALSSGTASLQMENDGYDICPDAEEIAAERGYDDENDRFNPSGSVFCSHGAGYYVPWDEVEEHLHIPVDTIRSPGSLSMNSGKVSEEQMRAAFERAGSNNRNQKKLAAEKETRKRNARNEARKKKTELSDEKVQLSNRIMLPELLIVDGYNMIYSWPELKEAAKVSLQSAREELISLLSDYQGARNGSLMIVFDGYRRPGNPGSKEQRGLTSIFYTPQGMNADSFIEKKVHDLKGKYRCTAATSDALIQNAVFASGASRISARELQNRIERSKNRIREQMKTSF